MGVIVLGALLLVGGIPKPQLTPNNDPQTGELVVETPDPKRENLQLKALRFKKCSSTAAVDLLVDTSGSMANSGKIGSLKSALSSFTDTLGDGSIIGLRRFSSIERNSPPVCPSSPATERLVQIEFLPGNKSPFNQAVSRLCADGSTSTRDAFTAEKNDLEKAINDPKFKDFSFNLIFLSDGIPESDANNKACPGGAGSPLCTIFAGIEGCRCFDTNQDPTSGVNIAQQIKDLKSPNGDNVRIFTIQVFDPQTDGYFKSKVDALMQNIASPNSYYTTTNPQDIKKLYDQISKTICTESG